MENGGVRETPATERGNDERQAEDAHGGVQGPVALAGFKGDKTANELSGHFGVHPTRIHAWKKQLLARAVAVFVNGVKPDSARPRSARPGYTSKSAGSTGESAADRVPRRARANERHPLI